MSYIKLCRIHNAIAYLTDYIYCKHTFICTGKPKNQQANFIVIFTLLQWDGTEPSVSLRDGYRWVFFLEPLYLCVFTGVLISWTFKMIIKVVGLTSTIFAPVLYSLPCFHFFLLVSSAFCGFNWAFYMLQISLLSWHMNHFFLFF